MQRAPCAHGRILTPRQALGFPGPSGRATIARSPPAAQRPPLDVPDLPQTAAVPDAGADPRPVAPEPPLPSDCCESGCDPCVYDSYSEALAYYREQLARWRARHPEAG